MSGPAVPADRVVLGRIAGVHGVRGWVTVESETRPREAIFSYSPWELGTVQGWKEFRVLSGRPSGTRLTAHLEGVDDRDVARELIGATVAVPRAQLPPAEAGTYYWADLEGCTVVNLGDVNFGIVKQLIETGANDVLVVENGRERLIPFVSTVVQQVDLAHRRIRVDWDEDF